MINIFGAIMKLYGQRRMKMKKILILFILIILLTSCFIREPYKCTKYQGDKKCVKYLDYEEIIWD